MRRSCCYFWKRNFFKFGSTSLGGKSWIVKAFHSLVYFEHLRWKCEETDTILFIDLALCKTFLSDQMKAWDGVLEDKRLKVIRWGCLLPNPGADRLPLPARPFPPSPSRPRLHPPLPLRPAKRPTWPRPGRTPRLPFSRSHQVCQASEPAPGSRAAGRRDGPRGRPDQGPCPPGTDWATEGAPTFHIQTGETRWGGAIGGALSNSFTFCSQWLQPPTVADPWAACRGYGTAGRGL